MFSHVESTLWMTPFGLIFIAGILMTWAFARRNAATAGILESHIDLLLPVTIATAIGVGIVVAVIGASDMALVQHAVSFGIRLRIVAMSLASALALFIYARLAGIPFRRLLDVFALPTLVGLMMHRIGCFLAGCCWGDVASELTVGNLAAQVQTFPALNAALGGVVYAPGSFAFRQHVALGLIEPTALTSLPVVPVQLYEAVLLLFTVLTLRRFPWRRCPDGTITVLALTLYAALRFGLEFLRADGSIVLGNLTGVQLQCIPFLFAAFLLPGLLRGLREPVRLA